MTDQFSAIRDCYPGDASTDPQRSWLVTAMQRINADFNRSADTHLQKLELPVFEGIDLYLKDESSHPSGSLKHRLARSLILYGLCNGLIGPQTTLIEASSGSTAVSEAYFARLLELPFIAVVPEGTSSEKLKEIARYGGRTVEVPAGAIYAEAERLADTLGGYYLDQFTNAERATDWRSNNNIAESLFQQLACERHPTPHWVVVGAGTGGTSATIGRYLRYRAEAYGTTRVCVADPEGSVFFDGFSQNDPTLTREVRSRIEGVGRPRVEPSFVSSVVDRMLKVPDALSIATVWWLRELTGRAYGPSTGLNLCASLFLAREMMQSDQQGSIVTLICDGGERYLDTCYANDWLAAKEIAVAPALAELRTWLVQE